MVDYASNQERTAEYLKNFDREKILKYLVREERPVIFDVGANVGDTLTEFKAWWPGARVHCFEPQHECWPLLEQQAEQHSEVVVNRFAAGNVLDDQATFYSHEISTGISGFNKVNMQSLDSVHLHKLAQEDDTAIEKYAESMNAERTVSIVRLDGYMNQFGIRHVNLLKIDTQGFEPEVLDGCGKALADVDVVITELMFYDYYERSLSFSDIERFLLPAGFHLYDINHIAKNPMNGRTDWVDVIYLNDRLRTGK